MKNESTSDIPPLAFPVCVPDQRGPEGEPLCEGFSSLGMELRDYFAAKAIGIFSLNEDELELLQSGTPADHSVVAKFCYGLADAMMAERRRRLTAEKKEEAK